MFFQSAVKINTEFQLDFYALIIPCQLQAVTWRILLFATVVVRRVLGKF
jgi:hypothetical protein